ncbi:hypothetical protein [Streptomyces longisporoflavus]|uniref:hypothetical protein n=1 Tax=Streptomyces longisporoflavus TaxID=28044 RepID=UPI00167E923C|nr:hypothetical protein [Streptomyces longisporoflavus]
MFGGEGAFGQEEPAERGRPIEQEQGAQIVQDREGARVGDLCADRGEGVCGRPTVYAPTRLDQGEGRGGGVVPAPECVTPAAANVPARGPVPVAFGDGESAAQEGGVGQQLPAVAAASGSGAAFWPKIILAPALHQTARLSPSVVMAPSALTAG